MARALGNRSPEAQPLPAQCVCKSEAPLNSCCLSTEWVFDVVRQCQTQKILCRDGAERQHPVLSANRYKSLLESDAAHLKHSVWLSECPRLGWAEGLCSAPDCGFASLGSDGSGAQAGNVPLLFTRDLNLLKTARYIIREYLLWKLLTSFSWTALSETDFHVVRLWG